MISVRVCIQSSYGSHSVRGMLHFAYCGYYFVLWVWCNFMEETESADVFEKQRVSVPVCV